MKKLNAMEMRNVEGGASKYVYCPVCGYKYKTNWFLRLFLSNSYFEGDLLKVHGLPKNLLKGSSYAQSQAVH